MSRRNGNKTFNSATRSALADSLAGVAGSLMSMLMFYPVDVYKTNLQAGKAPADEHDPFPGSTTSGQCIDIRRRNNLSTSMYTIRLLLSSYRGVHYKIAHTITSSFAYFFIYSWITSHHRSRLASRGETENGKEFEYARREKMFQRKLQDTLADSNTLVVRLREREETPLRYTKK